ncbi:uncharacterized protein BXZ73DRAFT_107393 [Epithele typhae]|uniref:uncharacterized protein n=1 Tax=Epithele typhae TaxID=378194 RepID=UPI00200766FB|nr:uncharacterized protein BXZ73DRAFT_107393 [Epithele typhae]KAH9912501.1 hypothetical protein BXZ73DRAFT_107393 [Epithele typhae]
MPSCIPNAHLPLLQQAEDVRPDVLLLSAFLLALLRAVLLLRAALRRHPPPHPTPPAPAASFEPPASFAPPSSPAPPALVALLCAAHLHVTHLRAASSALVARLLHLTSACVAMLLRGVAAPTITSSWPSPRPTPPPYPPPPAPHRPPPRVPALRVRAACVAHLRPRNPPSLRPASPRRPPSLTRLCVPRRHAARRHVALFRAHILALLHAYLLRACLAALPFSAHLTSAPRGGQFGKAAGDHLEQED